MLSALLDRYPCLIPHRAALERARIALISAFFYGGKLLLCGNGGSAADCEHIAGELCKAFLKKRPLNKNKCKAMKKRCPALSDATLATLEGALPAIPLTSFSALLTAFGNDKDPELAFAQAVLALGKRGDVLLAISTSGNSENVLRAAEVARGLGLKVIALTGEGGGALAALADVLIEVPERETFMVQELHLPIYHWLAAEVERYFFKN